MVYRSLDLFLNRLAGSTCTSPQHDKDQMPLACSLFYTAFVMMALCWPDHMRIGPHHRSIRGMGHPLQSAAQVVLLCPERLTCRHAFQKLPSMENTSILGTLEKMSSILTYNWHSVDMVVKLLQFVQENSHSNEVIFSYSSVLKIMIHKNFWSVLKLMSCQTGFCTANVIFFFFLEFSYIH